jgi:hypothetical protein
LGVAISKQTTDIWAHVQQDVARRRRTDRTDERRNGNTVPFPVAARTIELRNDPPAWHDPANQARAEQLFGELEGALYAGKARRAERLRAAWLRTLHTDRLGRARTSAASNSLRLDPMGRGPVVDRPTLHFRDRLPWGLLPLSPYDGAGLPDRARSIVDEWTSLGEAFDSFVVADEPPGTASFPTHCLIGAISIDGRQADWFVLDRWAS